MNSMWLDLFQDRNTRDITILPRAITGGREGRFGKAVTMGEEAFRERGLVAVWDIVDSANIASPGYEGWTTDNQLLWELNLKKPRTLALQFRADRDVAAVHILHYDNAGVTDPCDLGEEILAPLAGDPDAFAGVLVGAFERSKDFVWLSYDLLDVTAFFCLYSDEASGIVYWFDWVRIALPAPHTDAVTAWGRHQIFDEEGLRRQLRQRTIECLDEFALRREEANPLPNPRGSQVEDAGASDWRRVVVYRRTDENELFFRGYNYDTVGRKHEVSGHEMCVSVGATPADLYDVYLEILRTCEYE